MERSFELLREVAQALKSRQSVGFESKDILIAVDQMLTI